MPHIFPMYENLDWKQAYMAAILEKDSARTLQLIADARAKLAARLLELLDLGANGTAVPCQEVEAIHEACYLLEALKSSLLYRDEAAG